jgi:CRISPR system Cascade subunit CasD
MNTLLLRLSGAMQSWGVQSRFGVRDTGLEPSKSGVIGLVCAAMGIDRNDDDTLASLAALKMGVRVDKEGVLKVDYHTAQNVLKAGGGIKNTELSNRYYLADARFLVGLAGNDLVLLERIQAALRNPTWPLFLGRKSFIAGQTIWLENGLKIGEDLKEAFKGFSYLRDIPIKEELRWIIEDVNGDVVRTDQPISFSRRRFAPRRMKVVFEDPPLPILECPDVSFPPFA